MQISVRALGIVLCYPVQGLKTGLSAVKDNLHGKSGVAELQEVRDAKLPTIKANRAVMHCSMGEWAFFFFFFPWAQCIHYVSPEKIERAGRYLCLTAKKSLCVGPALKHLFGLVWMEEQSQAVVSAHTLRPSQVLKVALVAWEQGCHCPASPSASAPSLNITSASPVLIPGHAAVVGKPCWIPSLLNNGRRL